MKSTIFKNLIPLDIIESLKEYYDKMPEVYTEVNIINKNLEYHIPDNIAYKLLNPIIEEILPRHSFDTGSFKETNNPYPLHVDTYNQQLDKGASMALSTETNYTAYDSALIIPLVQDENFKTITFDIFSDFNSIDYNKYKQSTNNLIESDISHDIKARYLPVDKVFVWKLGDAFMWPRNQLHMSNNFVVHGLTKKFLVLFFK